MKRASVNMGMFAVVGLLTLLPIGALAQEAPAEAAKSSEGIVHTVVAGDTLWDLSAKYLGSPWKWTELWERNRFISNPHYIYPGIQVVIFPPGAREIALGQEAAPASGPAATVAAVPPPVEAVKPAVPPPVVPRVPYLNIKPDDFVRAGEFLKEAPSGVGFIQGGQEPKVGFVAGDLVYLSLGKQIPEGQLLGVYRVRGPIKGSGDRPVSGYVKYLIGVIQTGATVDGHVLARVRQSFEDLTQADLVTEEIPAWASVKIVPGEDGIPSSVITGRRENKEFAEGDFIYLDSGSSSGVAVGNVFRVSVPTVGASAAETAPAADILFEVARGVVVRVSPEFSTLYVVSSKESFAAGARTRRGIPAK
ncbi:MAG: LysM domain-containing protein [bacterium]|jgi:hypothetical protein